MNQNAVESLKNWFKKYVATYKGKYPEIINSLDMKEKHTYRVCREMVKIGKKLCLSDEELELAEIIALLHDVGRFEQYARNKSFRDTEKFNHAEYGIKIIERYRLLRHFSVEKQELACKAILYHNRAMLPTDEPDEDLFFAKMVRDADKLDIFEIVLTHYLDEKKKGKKKVEIDLPTDDELSEKVLNDVLNKKLVLYSDMKTHMDFKVLMFSWFYDINFWPSLQIMQERNYLQRLRNLLPGSSRIDRIYIQVYTDLQQRLKSIHQMRFSSAA